MDDPIASQAAVAASVARQAELLEVVGRLSGGIAHDFNNLLTSILGYAELLDEQLRVRGNSRVERGDVKQIRQAAERARELTLRLLAFARRMPVSPRVLDVNQILAGVERIVRRIVSDNVTLVLAFDASAGLVVADPAQLEQLTLSLCVNAIDAMPPGGVLTIASRALDLRHEPVPAGVVIGTHAPGAGEYVEIAVSDSGAGMSASFVQQAFQPYATTKPEGQGHGLGLSAVLGLVTQAAGTVLVDSAPGRGTVVRVLLPREQNADDLEITGGGASSEGNNGNLSSHGQDSISASIAETILLAEDDANVRELNARTLRSAGYIVHVAESGEAAIALADGVAMHFDLLVTDVVMPEKNGWDVVAAIRAGRPDAPVLLVSGLPLATHAPAKLPERGYPFLAKPFAPEALLGRVRELLAASPPRKVRKGSPA